MYKNKNDKFQVWSDKDEVDFNAVDSAEPIQPVRWEYTRDFEMADIAVNKFTGEFSLITYRNTNDNCYFVKLSFTIPYSKIEELLSAPAVGSRLIEPSPPTILLPKTLITKYINKVVA